MFAMIRYNRASGRVMIINYISPFFPNEVRPPSTPSSSHILEDVS